jgi:hypothetical protein
MTIPRSWTNIERQRSPDQTLEYAKPTATDIRFKLAALVNFIGWLTIVYSLRHSIKYYKPRNRGPLNRTVGFIKFTPFKFFLTIPLSLVMVGYDVACAFDFDVSPLKLHTNLGFMYGLGWGSIACIILVYEIAGYFDPNEDRELIRQRRVRGAEIDSEMGIVKKPHWWSRLHGDNKELNVHDRIARNVGELGGGRATAKNLERSIEMGNMPVSKKQDPNKPAKGDLEAVRMAASLLFPASATSERSDPFQDVPDEGRSPRGSRPREVSQDPRKTLSDRSISTNSGVSITAPPQRIRSMLDV